MKHDIGVDASEVRICVALKRLGLHRKAIAIKKIEGNTPHARLLLQRYYLSVFGYRLSHDTRSPTAASRRSCVVSTRDGGRAAVQ